MKILEKVFKFQLRNNSIVYYYQTDNKYYRCDFNGNLIDIIEVEDCHWFLEDENYLVNGYKDHLLVGYYKEGVVINQLKENYRPIVNNIGVAHDYTNSDGRTHKETLFHLPEEKQILQEWLPNRIYHIQDQYWCNDTEEDFKLIDAERGEILWTIPQPTVEKPYGYNGFTNIKKVLGIYKGNIWLQLPDSRLWAVDIQTGKISNVIEHFYFSAIPDGIFLSQVGHIIIFHYNIYAEYSLENNEFITDKVISDENKLIIRNVLFRENDMRLYFTGNKNNSFYPNVYGIFNREKLNFEFMEEQLTENSFFYQTPQVNDEVFTILDSEGNLIIHKMKEILKN